MNIDDFSPKRVLVVTPHPDDAEIGAGGTLSRWIAQGAACTLVVCTNGDKGSEDPEMTSPRLAAIREREQQEAAEVLGLRDVIFLRHPDGDLEDTRVLRGQIVREIRRTRPDVVLTTDPHRRTFYLHRDHRIAGQVTLDAVFPFARDRLSFPEQLEEGLSPHKTPYIFLWGSDAPDHHIDIAGTLDMKIAALRKHASQVAAQRERDFTEFLRQMAQRAGKDKGMEAAEAFRVIEIMR